MDKKTLLETVKGMSREERVKFFHDNNADFDFCNAELENVTGGSGLLGGGNPTSADIDDHNNWWTSQGYMCKGEIFCN